VKLSQLSLVISSIRMQATALSTSILLHDHDEGEAVEEVRVPRILIQSIHGELMGVAKLLEESLNEDQSQNPLLTRGELLKGRSLDPPEDEENDDG
jgi:ABC-type enterochelin transport system permease subunit